ncbi:protein kinase [Actinoplanes sp. NPDC051475]|uniref:serine/threonine-protein kinase n=1 Tax=Actinoplanes sp. NPDC051475 TaxID=3157225 RepID=UPI00344B5C6C
MEAARYGDGVSTSAGADERPTSTGFLLAGRYRLERRIGRGGMGVVWSARDEVLRRTVAVKELHHDYGSSDQTVAAGRERSLREARAAAALHHPNIVAVYDVVVQDDRPWIVMEQVPGRSLKDLIGEHGPMAVDRVLGIADQLLSALHAAHLAGITHRDVKPANVLICPDDVVRLTDFGLASMQDVEPLTETGAVLGTPGYLAPEQAKGLPPGPAADVFGAGATVYYAIEGVGPFQRDGYLPMLAAYARQDIRAPRLAGALGPVLVRLLAADPARRPNAQQAAALLRGARAGKPGVARRQVLLGAALAGSAAVGTGGWWALRHGRPAAPHTAAAASTPPRPRPGPPVGLAGPAWSSDNLRGAVPAGTLLVGVRTGVVTAVETQSGQARWRGTADGVARALSVGAGLVLAYRETGVSKVLDAATGAVHATYDHGDPIGAADGVTFVGAGGALYATDLRTGRRRWELATEYLYASVVACAGGLLGVSANPLTDDEVTAWWLYGVQAHTGAVRWRTEVARATVPAGVWSAGGALHAAMADLDGRVRLAAHDSATGAHRWTAAISNTKQSDSKVTVTGVVSVGTLTVVAVSDTALNPEHCGVHGIASGSVRWHRPLLNPAVAVTTGGRLFAGSADSRLHELDPASGATRWSTATPGPVDTLIASGTMLVAGIGQRVAAYRLQTG